MNRRLLVFPIFLLIILMPVTSAQPTPQSPPASFAEPRCGKIIAAAEDYLGVKYAYSGPSPLDPQTARHVGLTCAGFVKSALRRAGFEKLPVLKDSKARTICDDTSVVTRLGNTKDKIKLQPGYIFASNALTSDYGHTGIFVEYKDGEPVYIHSFPNGGVQYVRHSNLFKGGRHIIQYCRLKVCS